MRAVASLLLAAAGAGVLLVVIEGAGGDFGDWPQWRAIAVPVAAVVVPAAVAGLVARRGGVVEALLWAVATAGLVVALVLGAGFLMLGLGPES